MRKLILLAVALLTATTAHAQKFGNSGGIGSNTSVYSSGEPTGGTFSINGASGEAIFRSQKVGNPTDASAAPVAIKANGATPTLTIGTSIYPANVGGSASAKYDATSNVLTNALGAKYGLFGAAAKDNATWANGYISGIDATGRSQLYSISTGGSYGAAFASRSSDNSNAAQSVIGSVSLGVADNAARNNMVWAGYDATYVTPLSIGRGAIGREISLINAGATPTLGDPYNINATGFTNALRLDCGDGVAVSNGCSSAMTIAPNNGQALAGIVIADGALTKTNGYAPAMAMPASYGLDWYTAKSKPAWRIASNASGAQLSQMVMGDNALDVYVANGVSHPLSVNAVGVTTPNIVIGNLADTGDGAITTSTTNLQILRKASATAASTGIGGANEFPLFSSVTIPNGHGSGVDYEVAAMYGRCATADPNSGGNAAYDCVGSEAQGLALAPCKLCRVWGHNNVVEFQSNADGMGIGFESDTLNRGTTGALQTPQQKIGSYMVCRTYNNCTAAFVAGSDGVAKWNYGFTGVRQYFSGDCFSCLLEGNVASLPIYAGIFTDGHMLAQGSSVIVGQPGTTRYQTLMSGPNASALVKRWEIGANAAAESGANMGSDYQVCSYSDAGTLLTCPLLIQRSSNVMYTTNQSIAASLHVGGKADVASLRLNPTTFSALPTCNASVEGTIAYINDASAAITAWHQAVSAGGGSSKAFVACNASGWLAFD